MTNDPVEDGRPPDAEERTPRRKRRETPEERGERIARESAELRSALNDGVLTDVRTRVASVMNLYPHTRNSDVALALKYWELFQPDFFSRHGIRPENLFRLERMTTITRARAKIQNDYQLFQADGSVRQRRRGLEEDAREAAVEDKPSRNVVRVFSDETGKTQDFMCVASVWVLSGYEMFRLTKVIRNWREQSPWANGELHFTDLRKHHVDAALEYIDLVAANRTLLGFKVIAVERATLRRSVEEAIKRLHEFMLIEGAKHEIASGRVALPQEISLTVDAEESLDAIACADIKRAAEDAYQRDHGPELTIGEVTAVSSHKSELVQLADFVAGAVNRRKNHRGDRGFKDDVADAVIERLGIQLESNEIPGMDASVWFSL